MTLYCTVLILQVTKVTLSCDLFDKDCFLVLFDDSQRQERQFLLLLLLLSS